MVVLEGRNERERKNTAKQDRPLIFSLSLSLSCKIKKVMMGWAALGTDRPTSLLYIIYLCISKKN